MTIGSVISSTVNKIRKVVITTLGGTLTREPIEVSPFGHDSCPVPGMIAVYSDTTGSQVPVLIGYLNISALAQPGENRQFSTDKTGNLVTYTWLHSTAGAGQIEIGGTADNAVGYNTLNSLLQHQAININTQLTAIAAAINSIVAGSYTPTLLSTNFTTIKKSEIVTI